ncbi:MAG: lactate utilization protein [Lachnospiraceae bacterium]|nr:lactate utilization protein [Lachnospiraceae bacterium]MDY5497852.1 lactate utilization protein [Anaerobutyricum sp.]
MTPKQNAWRLQADSVIRQMERRHFHACYCSTKEEAFKKALSIIEKGSVVASGGSETLKEIGLLDYIKSHPEDYTYLDRSKAGSEEEKRKIHAKTILSDYFLMSTNAFTADGQLVNIDGNGNRVGALCFGPKHVIIITGMNKLVPTVEDAYKRIRQGACPPNCLRLNLETPCAKTGFCGECLSGSSICASFVTTRMSRNPDRIHVILVGETLGY